MNNNIFRPALVLFALLSVLTGLVYPMAVTGAAKAMFPSQAAGSLIVHNGTTVGSRLIGQNFSDPKHFWGRPSATAPQPYNARLPAARTKGRSTRRWPMRSRPRRGAARRRPGNTAPVPVDLVTASASGLDPDISPAAAQYQAARVARARGLTVEEVSALVARSTQAPLWGLLGEPRVNVLALNLALDGPGLLAVRQEGGPMR
jgi:K+-transporting ATPase ATPase C chain